ncbi:MAG: chorismate pyruvate-lyase family protein [Gemmatimonadota bacterium]
MVIEDQFDPLRGLSPGPAASAGGVSPVNLRVLTAFQRALLVIDGTVTKFIEAYAMEPLDVMRLRQEESISAERHEFLDLEGGQPVLEREVVIRGRYSDTLYVYAVSHIVPSRLPGQVRRRLEVQGEGIGRILRDEKLETRREVLWFGREKLKSLPDKVRDVAGEEFISRAYRIILDGSPIVVITERFPLALRRIA